MICSLPKESKESLYFTVATETELFYAKELKRIENLDLHIHITKEKHEDHKHGRVDVDTIIATPDTEWYLCGNPRMIDEATTKLRARGYDKVYSEEFN
jgi:NAD(P)H-flavin reductase